jgi:peptide/nickel transport system substrate-binding protein
VFLFQGVEQAALRANVKGFISGPSFDLVFYREVTKS